jgi:threonine/homoserine/homoserine lactone efflux protein
MLAYLALLGFVVFMVGTPGPANLVVMIAGARFGLRRSVGFILGLVSGKIALNLCIGFGLGVMLAEMPIAKTVFGYTSAAYMIYLAVRSWPSDARGQMAAPDQPASFTFSDGVIVHPLNPKAWVMSILAWGEFAPALGAFSVQLPVVVLTFACCQLVLHSLWCWLGEFIGRSLDNSVPFTRLMILATVGIVVAVILI